MILNEDYFDDLDIKDEDIIDDDINDVDEPVHELTVEELYKLSEQYNCICIEIRQYNSDASIKTSLLPRIIKRLNVIFDLYGIEHSEYVLSSSSYVKDCNTVVKFGNYQLFCAESKKDNFINNTYSYFYINAYVNYPEFTYKRTFRFLYTMLNLYKYCKEITWMAFKAITTDLKLQFGLFINHIYFNYNNLRTGQSGTSICLDMELIEGDKRYFYNYVMHHFFGDSVKVPYDAIERDVPIKPLRV